MSPLFDDLEAQLAEAARRRTRRARRRLGGALPVLAAAAVTVAVVVGAFALLGHSGRSPGVRPASSPGAVIAHIPLKRLRRELAYIGQAERGVLAQPVCHVDSSPRTTFVHAAPGRALTAILAPLRRPATRADRLPAVVEQGIGEPIDIGWTRRARVVDGTAYYLVPMRNDPAARQPSPRCLEREKATLLRYAPRIPASLRAQTLRVFTAMLDYDLALITGAPGQMLCVVSVQGNGSGAQCGLTAAQVRSGADLGEDNGTQSYLLPDGVATVTITFRARPGRPAAPVTGRVVNNLLVVRFPSEAAQPAVVVWRAADGRILKTIDVPTPAQFCARHVALCASGMSISESSSGSASSSVAGTMTATASTSTSR